MLTAVCVLSPAHLENVLGFISFRLRFGGVLRGRFVPRTWFDRVPAGTVLVGTRLFRTRSDYKKWCVPRTCSENMFPLELYREQVWTSSKKLFSILKILNIYDLITCTTYYVDNRDTKLVYFLQNHKSLQDTIYICCAFLKLHNCYSMYFYFYLLS